MANEHNIIAPLIVGVILAVYTPKMIKRSRGPEPDFFGIKGYKTPAEVKQNSEPNYISVESFVEEKPSKKSIEGLF